MPQMTKEFTASEIFKIMGTMAIFCAI